jgi:hypothetical protein
MKFSLSYQNHLYSGVCAQHPTNPAAAFHPSAASGNGTTAFYTNYASEGQNQGGSIDYCHNTQAQMVTGTDEHGVSSTDQGNLSVLAFAAMLGDKALEDF